MSGSVDGLPVAGLRASGLLPHSSATAEVIERFGVPGSADPARVLVSRVLGGFESEVIPSRGLDIGPVYWRGVPISWRSPVQDSRPLDRPAGTSWLERFTGGLLTTCGPWSFGKAHGEHGMHGEFSHRPAMRVTASADGSTHITGSVEFTSVFGPSMTVDRTIVSTAEPAAARLHVIDDVHNTGPVDSPVALLYHVNFGAPIVAPGSIVKVEADGWRAREEVREVPDPSILPRPCSRPVEAVFEHLGLAVDTSGWSRTEVRRPGSALVIEVAWRADTLPHLHQWVYPTAGRWALGIEPATESLLARGERAAALIPVDGVRRHEIMVTVREAT